MADLVLAIMRRHTEPMERTWARMVTEPRVAPTSATGPPAWCGRAEHLSALGSPTWFARFCAQVTSDPALCEVMIDTASGPTSFTGSWPD